MSGKQLKAHKRECFSIEKYGQSLEITLWFIKSSQWFKSIVFKTVMWVFNYSGSTIYGPLFESIRSKLNFIFSRFYAIYLTLLEIKNNKFWFFFFFWCYRAHALTGSFTQFLISFSNDNLKILQKKKNYIPDAVTTLTVWEYRNDYVLWVNNES